MPDRPVECSQCKKPVKVTYKEIVDDSVICTEMCADCPVLQAKLHGEPGKGEQIGKESTLCCGNCGTPLEAVTRGEPLGCAECYAVFADFLIGELIESKAIPSTLSQKLTAKRLQAIHIGKSPDKPHDITLSSRLASLNEALNEALKRENYEQAAWLRDQIKALSENKNAS
ncbi:MAG: UvrB/UvrC motif-containing protein [Verrucomicrobia bacterium]|nr:UvrB/UvrC motif-containing protein [Verrucomicrobiota bacterium]